VPESCVNAVAQHCESLPPIEQHFDLILYETLPTLLLQHSPAFAMSHHNVLSLKLMNLLQSSDRENNSESSDTEM
jgi:hypothetical protein